MTQPFAPIGAGPAVSAFEITKNDTTVFPSPTRYIYVGGAGDLAVLLSGDTVPVTLSAVPAGTVLPLCATKVMATNTTATLIVGMR